MTQHNNMRKHAEHYSSLATIPRTGEKRSHGGYPGALFRERTYRLSLPARPLLLDMGDDRIVNSKLSALFTQSAHGSSYFSSPPHASSTKSYFSRVEKESRPRTNPAVHKRCCAAAIVRFFTQARRTPASKATRSLAVVHFRPLRKQHESSLIEYLRGHQINPLMVILPAVILL